MSGEKAEDRRDAIRGGAARFPRLPVVRPEESHIVSGVDLALEMRAMMREILENTSDGDSPPASS